MKDKKSSKALGDLAKQIKDCTDKISEFNETNKCCSIFMAQQNFAKLNGAKEDYDKSMNRVMCLYNLMANDFILNQFKYRLSN